MTSARRLRKSISDAIASAAKTDATTSSSGLRVELDKIFASFIQEGVDENTHDEDDDNVTPLMMACDKSCTEALQYFESQLSVLRKHGGGYSALQSSKALQVEHLVEAWGHPREVSVYGNGAAHHALTVGFTDGLDMLGEKLWVYIDGESKGVHLIRYLSLLSQTNKNGDTPIMMACVSGHVSVIQYVLNHSFQLALNVQPEHICSSVRKTWEALRKVFNVKNHEDLTALNLACGHGHIDIVKFCIEPHPFLCPKPCDMNCGDEEGSESSPGSERSPQVVSLKPLIKVSYLDVEFCKKSVDNLAAGLKYMKSQNQKDKIKEFKVQHKQASKCLSILEGELEKISSETAKELLMNETPEQSKNAATSGGGQKEKGKSKKKKKLKRDKSKNTKVTPNDTSETTEGSVSDKSSDELADVNAWVATKNTNPESAADVDPSINDSPFVTLQDGNVVSKSRRSPDIVSNLDDGDDAVVGTLSSSIPKPKSLQGILQSTPISSSTNSEDDIAAIMESLCLEPSMLLLSSHGMAMEASPCQLEAIESILSHQLNATREAQKIQRRLLHK